MKKVAFICFMFAIILSAANISAVNPVPQEFKNRVIIADSSDYVSVALLLKWLGNQTRFEGEESLEKYYSTIAIPQRRIYQILNLNNSMEPGIKKISWKNGYSNSSLNNSNSIPTYSTILIYGHTTEDKIRLIERLTGISASSLDPALIALVKDNIETKEKLDVVFAVNELQQRRLDLLEQRVSDNEKKFGTRIKQLNETVNLHSKYIGYILWKLNNGIRTVTNTISGNAKSSSGQSSTTTTTTSSTTTTVGSGGSPPGTGGGSSPPSGGSIPGFEVPGTEFPAKLLEITIMSNQYGSWIKVDETKAGSLYVEETKWADSDTLGISKTVFISNATEIKNWDLAAWKAAYVNMSESTEFDGSTKWYNIEGVGFGILDEELILTNIGFYYNTEYKTISEESTDSG